MQPILRVDPTALGDIPLFSAAQAEADGMSDKDLRILLRRGLILRVARGWYTTRVDASTEELHVLTTVAVLRMQAGRVGAARHSAALLHGLPVARTDLSRVELVRTSTTHGRTRSGVRMSLDPRASLAPADVPLVGGAVLAVTVAQAVVGTAVAGNPVAGLVAGDHALRHRLCTRAEIENVLDRSRGLTGIGAARDVLGHLDPRHESPGETLLGWEMRGLGWEFDPQVWIVARGRRYRPDFKIRRKKVAAEFDGEGKYTGPEVMEAQLRREADMRAEGWTFARFGWPDLGNPFDINMRLLEAVREHDRLSEED